jgi:hypothetical protein
MPGNKVGQDGRLTSLSLSVSLSLSRTTACPKRLEPMGILIIFLILIYRLKLTVKKLRMALTLDKGVEIVLLSGRQGWTQRQVADEFNVIHPERNPITHSAVGNLVKKFKETGSVVDKLRVGRPSVGEDI